MNIFDSPIIFIHYGNSDYLQYTIKCAILHNPNKKIILLGDSQNEKLANKFPTLYFRHFKDFENDTKIEKFNSKFQFIAGANHGKPYWVNFVFKRWLIVNNFIKIHSIKSLWIFDSDNLILNSLSKIEHRFLNYDATEQCNHMCLNGFISNIEVIEKYTDTIINLFDRKELLDSYRKEFETNTNYAFTEMRAYEIFKKEHNYNILTLNTIFENSTFDECLCQNHEMKMIKSDKYKYVHKELYTDKFGNFYTKKLISNEFVHLHSINLSWLPLIAYKNILKQASKKLLFKKNDPFQTEIYLFNLLYSNFIELFIGFFFNNIFIIKEKLSGTIQKNKI
ncbi:MAG: hypothetical protein SFY32_01450 [Bacteroidota bacterium]|nr:hypothetical protein [Bacteroidota bacterium]